MPNPDTTKTDSPLPLLILGLAGTMLASGVATFVGDPEVTRLMCAMLVGWSMGAVAASLIYAKWKEQP